MIYQLLHILVLLQGIDFQTLLLFLRFIRYLLIAEHLWRIAFSVNSQIYLILLIKGNGTSIHFRWDK